MEAKCEPFVICKQSGRYIGWPTVARTGDGELLVAFSGDRDLHVCPFGKTFVVRSGDDGRSWSDPQLVNDTLLDDRDAGLLVLASGTILLTWFTSLAFEDPDHCKWQKDYEKLLPSWSDHVSAITADDRLRWIGSWSRRSTDGGRTWEDPVAMAGTCPHGPAQLADGRVVQLGNLMNVDHGRIVCEETADDGRSWAVIGEVPLPPEARAYRMGEPHLCGADNGDLVGMFRCNPPDPADCGLWAARSTDGGRTWSTPQDTPMKRFPPHLLNLGDGRILLSYGHRLEPYGEMACLSRDDGATWDLDNEIMVCNGPNGDLGYPASVRLGDGRILTVFYQTDSPGEKPCLMGGIWSLD